MKVRKSLQYLERVGELRPNRVFGSSAPIHADLYVHATIRSSFNDRE